MGGEGEDAHRIEASGGLSAVDWNWDGEFLAAHSHARLQVWETEGWTQVYSRGTHTDGFALSWAPHAPLLAFGARTHQNGWPGGFLLWNAKTDELKLLSGSGPQLLSIAWNSDGSRLAFGGLDCDLHLWDMESMQEIDCQHMHDLPVRDIAWAPDDRRIASVAARDHVVTTAVNAKSRRSYRRFDLTGRSETLAWHPHDPVLAVGQQDGAISLWRLDRGERVARQSLRGRRRNLTWSRDGEKLASSNHLGDVDVLDVAAGRSERIVDGDGTSLSGLVWGAGDTEMTLIDFLGPRRARTWSMPMRAFIRDLELTDRGTWMARSIPGTSWLAVAYQGSWAGIVTERGELRHRLTDHIETTPGIAVSADGTKVATYSRDSTAIVWDVKTGRRLATMQGHRSPVTGAAWSPGGSRLVTCGQDGTVRLWDSETGEEVLRLDIPDAVFEAVGWSSDGHMIAATDREDRLYVWSARMDLNEQLLRQAHRYANRKEWRDAAAAFGRAAELDTGAVASCYLLRGLCLLMADETDEYRATCRDFIAWATDLPNPDAATYVAWACAFAEDALPDYSFALQLAREGVRAGGGAEWPQKTLGGVLYRAGQVNEAIAELEKVPREPGTYGEVLFLLALAYEAKGNRGAAQRYLIEGESWTDNFLRNDDRGARRRWFDRASLEILRREAQRAVTGE